MEGESSENAKSEQKEGVAFYVEDEAFDYSCLNRKRDVPSRPVKRSVHPFPLRVKDSAGFAVDSPLSLIGAGFASLAMGLFALFRPTPLLLFSIAVRLEKDFGASKEILLISLFAWHGTLLFVFIVLGTLLAASTRIKKRWVLMLHPWSLILLYFDVFVWVSLCLMVHVQFIEEFEGWPSVEIPTPLVYFIVIYVESGVFWMIYYAYATYFIAAELTVIERHFC